MSPDHTHSHGEGAFSVRLAVDIGGTFTDVAVETPDGISTAKVLTTTAAPEWGAMEGIHQALRLADVQAHEVGMLIHGTTLATNAIIERKGAKTALVVTQGFRDSVEMAYENRFEQYDINIEKPAPLVPRYLRLPVTERVGANGDVLIELDDDSVTALIPLLEAHEIESVAIGLLHCYANPAHEQRVARMLEAALPDLWITLSSEVCPEIREYERLSTACANAYVQPLMSRYLQALQSALRASEFTCPLFLMMSGGGLTTIDTAIQRPIRLVESGPAGGAILASRIAAEQGLDQVLSFDMGGTTAKICLIDDGQPQHARTFEVDRVYRFTKGSGLPLRIPVIDMVEIGAGGGSIAHVDSMQRINVGPQSAGAAPGPACYGRGGAKPTVTDADVILGRIDLEEFAGGTMALDFTRAQEAMSSNVGQALNLTTPLAAFSVSEMVDENMANAARVHAIEKGKDVGSRTLIAFGGAAPLHAARLAQKLGIGKVIVPTDAGVGSAIGFLSAPVSYEVVRSRYTRLSALEVTPVNAMLKGMREEAERVVRLGAPEGELVETRIAYMRYVGQGHEVEVPLPLRALKRKDADTLQQAFDETYVRYYGRTIPRMDVEILTWALNLNTATEKPAAIRTAGSARLSTPYAKRQFFDTDAAEFDEAPIYRRNALKPGMKLRGPALIVEPQTTTVVSKHFQARIDARDHIILERLKSL